MKDLWDYHFGRILPLLLLGLGGGCKESLPTLFKHVDPQESGFIFTNHIKEDAVYNALDFTNLYTGSGVGIGDINQDGLPDIFMGACMGSSKLFLNKGSMKFEDITLKAQVNTESWVTGVSMVDINQDGWEDMYLSVSGPKVRSRKNLLFINQQDGTFSEEAEAYGLADSAQCTHANFFDYDRDGDLDVYLAVNPTDYAIYDVNTIRKRKLKGEAQSTDKLYRNNGDLTFTDVSKEAGILIEGYTLGLSVADINQDGWSDIYVANDFLSNDILYINQQNGTFRNESRDRLKHTSFASMGIDIADLNNDGLSDIYVLDMFPEDPYREKMLLPGEDYNRFRYILQAGYEPQYSRNVLQLQNSNGTFSEIGQLAGVHRTDWSWSALLADFDNDGFKDIFVANGFLKDLGDLDYINFNKEQVFGNPEAIRARQLEQIVKQQPIKLPNYLFKNEGEMSFSNQTRSWGLSDSTCSNGAAYADLDLDGDLDIIINNLNQASQIYENLSEKQLNSHFLKIQLEGNSPNRKTIGAQVWVYGENGQQYRQFRRYRGYKSSVGTALHFGLGASQQVDSLVILWPNGFKSSFFNLPVDTLLYFSQQNAEDYSSILTERPSPIFAKVSPFKHLHEEDPHSDFYNQVLLPHEFAQLGPALTVADLDQNGEEDIFIGAAAGKSAKIFFQKKGSFEPIEFPYHSEKEDVDALSFDADQDGDMDLYVVSGGSMANREHSSYQDRLYLNDGTGSFLTDSTLPLMPSSTACVRAGDKDGDGDLDLFIGGRLIPGSYPSPPKSYLLENRSGSFVDVTDSLAPELKHIGMVTDAEWLDYNQDGQIDLIMVGEWMPITVFSQNAGRFSQTEVAGLSYSSGWWNCLQSIDFDQDGDIDFLAGNLGRNTPYKASQEFPVSLYAKDFDNNGSIDPILCQYRNQVEYLVASRDKLIQQIAYIKSQFPTYHSYAQAPFSNVFPSKTLKGALSLKSYWFENSLIENKGNGNYELKALPWELQMAPIQDIMVEDINHDGFDDALLVGNSYGTEVKTGRYDAFTGAVLLGNKSGAFEVRLGAESGFWCDKNARKIARVSQTKHNPIYIVANNSDTLQFFTPYLSKDLKTTED